MAVGGRRPVEQLPGGLRGAASPGPAPSSARFVGAEPDVVEHRAGLGDQDLLENGDDAGLLLGGVRSAGRLAGELDCPASGACTPLRIFTSVLLPEPFSPTRAWTSPARSSNEASLSAWVGRTPSPRC